MLPWYMILWNFVKLFGVVVMLTAIFGILGIALLGGSGASLTVCAVVGVVAGWGWFVWQIWRLSVEDSRRFQQQEYEYWRKRNS